MKLNLPSKITIARIALILPVIVFYALLRISNWFVIPMTAFYVIASCTDFIDGHIARSRNMVTTLGKFLDPIADKVLVATGLIIIVNMGMFKLVGVIGAIIILGRELAISAFRQIAASKGVIMAADKLGKLKTVFTLIAIPAIFLARLLFINITFVRVIGYIFYIFGFVMFVISLILTVVSGYNYIVSNKKVFEDNDEHQDGDVTATDDSPSDDLKI